MITKLHSYLEDWLYILILFKKIRLFFKKRNKNGHNLRDINSIRSVQTIVVAVLFISRQFNKFLLLTRQCNKIPSFLAKLERKCTYYPNIKRNY